MTTTQTQDELIQETINAITGAATAIRRVQSIIAAKTDSTEALKDAVTKITAATSAAQMAKNTKVAVSFSSKAPSPGKSKPTQKQINWGQNIFAGIIFGFAFLLLLNEYLVRSGHIWSHHDVPPGFAVFLLILVDAFLFCLLIAVAHRGTHLEDNWLPYIPDRLPAVFLLIFLYAALVMLFSYMNLKYGLMPDKMQTDSMQDSVYQSILTFTTLEHTTYNADTLRRRILLSSEFLSIVLLIVVFFPLLIARLAIFRGDVVSADELKGIFDLQNGLLVSADCPVQWTVSREEKQVPGEKKHVPSKDNQVRLKLDERGNLTIERAQQASSA
jgi:magnesium-transporting ATPase (P-type)